MLTPKKTAKITTGVVIAVCVAITSFTFLADEDEAFDIAKAFQQTTNERDATSYSVEGNGNAAATAPGVTASTQTSTESQPMPEGQYKVWYQTYRSSRSAPAVPTGTKIGKTGKKFSRCGCGFCSLSHMMININTAKCGNMTPMDFSKEVPASVYNCWAGGSASWSACFKWVEWLNSLNGKYGKWKVIKYNEAGSPSATKDIIDNYLIPYASDPNTAVVVSSSSGMFTTGNHWILCIHATPDYFLILDSSGQAESYCGVENGHMGLIKFPTNSTSYKGHNYAFKCCWVIKMESP